MARKARIEYEGAYYHVINRGNYRSWIFESEGARKSFLECLQLACNAKGWSKGSVHVFMILWGTEKGSFRKGTEKGSLSGPRNV